MVAVEVNRLWRIFLDEEGFDLTTRIHARLFGLVKLQTLYMWNEGHSSDPAKADTLRDLCDDDR